MNPLGRLFFLLRNASFRRQLSIMIAVGILLLTLLTSLVISWQSSRETRQNRQQQGERLADNLAEHARLALLVDSGENAANALLGVQAFPDVVRVEIRHLLSGRLLTAHSSAGTAPAAAAEAPPAGLSASAFLEFEDGEAWHFVAPVRTTDSVSPFAREEKPGETLGYVRIVLSKSSLNRSMSRLFALNLGVAFLFSLVFLLFIRWLSFRMMQPLQKLTKAMASTQDGHSEVRAVLAGPSDIVSMARAFNNMMAVIGERERALRDRDKALSTILETTLDGFWCTDRHGILLDLNPAYCQQSGYRREALLGTKIFDLLTKESAVEIVAQARRIIESGKGLFESTQRRKDGSIWHAEVSVTYHNSSGGQFFVFLRDITERKRAESEIRRLNADLEGRIVVRTADLSTARDSADAANRAKTRFLAAASHDLRQPIQAINLFNDALLRTELSEQQKHISQYLTQSVASLGELLNALLDISKLDAGVVEPRFEVLSVENLFKRIDAGSAAMATEKALRFKLFFPFRAMAIITDGRLLMSLLNNLIGNAIKYTEQGGVLVGIRRRGNQALIQVWDTGIGIAPEDRGHIFEEYFQIANAARDRAKGLGLGLAIVKRLARLLETEVVCRSVPGKGSVFEFLLPLAGNAQGEASRQIELPETGVVPLAALFGKNVVVVEDDLMVAKGMRLSLESFGLRVTTYVDAEEALLNPEIMAADFFISDFRLPGMNGVQFLDTIQQRAPQPIKAVLLTGDTSPDRIEITESSNWTVLFKPVDPTRLLSAIKSQASFSRLP